MYRVFLVDDEPFIIEGLYDIIDWAALGLEIVGHAGNGQKALDALKHTPADILITDISMPVMTGLELVRAVREWNPGLKVIILSGFNEFDYLKEGMRLGIENYLLKPIDVQELRSTLTTTTDKLNAAQAERVLGEQDMRILKEHIMHRWLTGQIAPNEFDERAELLQLQLNRPYVLVALVRFPEGDTGDADFAAEQKLPGLSVIPFHNMDGELVVVFTLDEPAEGKRAALEMLARMKADHAEASRSCRISLGSVERLPYEAAQSYAHAKKAQEFFLLYQGRDILDYEEVAVSGETAGLDFPLEWAEYSKLILAKDKDSLLARIDQDYERLLAQEGMTPARLQQISIELMIRFKMELKAIKHTDSSELYQEAFDRVLHAGTVDRMADAVKTVAGLTVDSLIQDVRSPVIQQVLKLIHDSYAEELSLKTLSGQFNIHPVYLGHLFHKETGENFTEYINKYRIEKAKTLLKETHLKVQEIAKTVGYWETSYFYKQFKKYVGISPTDYKGLL
ncbi:response regulator transcription factor [Paenibacillus tyrfis]|uniref:response regulator transcription factor n=1 Tax=Paenibacillus tyrfis TaxID=1501230 RepID=UPI00209F633C|nr:response regulator transcription factor [Paenibacillus tyrfis]MCP1310880.1 response regulator transcription factor [Paenibacillus tyrfis]